ncbi:MAG: hypothetical protein MJE68_11595 [Proteobacteria bacterium]|nr:hypothetical protein [Pseudomonadota bacterium]
MSKNFRRFLDWEVSHLYTYCLCIPGESRRPIQETCLRNTGGVQLQSHRLLSLYRENSLLPIGIFKAIYSLADFKRDGEKGKLLHGKKFAFRMIPVL